MKRSRLISLFLLQIILLATATPLLAEETDAGVAQYLQFKAGPYFPKQGSSSTSTSFDAGYGISPRPYLAFEANVGYLQSSDKKTVYDIQYSALSATGAAKGIYQLGLGNLYALVGGGFYYAMFHINDDHAALTVPASDSDTTFGYFYGLGGELYTARSVSLGMEVRWLKLQATFDKVRNSTIAAKGDHDYDGTQAMIKVMYNF